MPKCAPTGSGPLQAPLSGRQSASVEHSTSFASEQNPVQPEVDLIAPLPLHAVSHCAVQASLLSQVATLPLDRRSTPSGAPPAHSRVPDRQLTGELAMQTVPTPGMRMGSIVATLHSHW